MITILMIALAVVLLLVAVGSLVSYLRETSKYKNTFKKSIIFYPILHKRGSQPALSLLSNYRLPVRRPKSPWCRRERLYARSMT